MNNLFVVRTPLQLLSAYILAYSQGSPNYNHLMLLNPRGEELWHKGYCVNKMSTDTGVWGKITMCRHRIVRRSEIRQIKKRLADMRSELSAHGDVDMVYLGADREFDNQLLVQLAGKSSYARFDDGVWSYSSPEQSFLQKLEFLLWAKFVHLYSRFPNTMTYNLRSGGYGKAAVADYLFKPELLQRYSPQAVAIDRKAIHAALDSLTQGMQTDERMEGRNSIIFLGSTHVDKKLIERGCEETVLEGLYRLANEAKIQLVYKPHPFENKEKLAYYRQNMPAIYFADFADPIEILVYKYSKIQAMLAYSSSGLLYADVFARQNIKSIALFDLYPVKEKDPYLKNILKAANVSIPIEFDNLVSIMRNL
ncbi:hypothetical protein SOV_40800 [Sporomusa ovata DSM 2662]|uniref:Uncharacterized protein n=1 Tax=Sporomusa ovata TaxID=2378 RepID=A0A0U1KT01_9FIRM|nr:polysialyltransferase family glycosyltransferase [Sporomusa ovata]EQB26468.1 hypothetical protein SOV_3c03420 [Sporomusa ovata DSM 2662]CQR70552.1 hypothetical protein SpAn4DRAFT_1521 [Sporomusa ovata]